MIPFRNNVKKSTLSFKVIVVCLLLSGSLITPGFARSYCYITNEDGTVLTDDGDCTGSLVIDNTVTSIGINAFKNNTLLTSVTIGSSVTSIGNYAFDGNTALTSVIIGNSVTTIGEGAFRLNIALEEVTIPNSVTSIGSAAFQYNFASRSVTIGNSVTSIGNDAFYDNIRLTSVTIPNSVSSIGNYAFYNNTALTSVTFLGTTAPPTVGEGVFQNVATGAKANVPYNATGFNLVDGLWKGLIVSYASAPVDDPPPSGGDSGSSSSNVATITPTVVQTADASFKLTNRKYLSKFEIRKAISKGRSFKRKPIDIYKYSISKRSKKNCVMSGNYVMALKETGACEIGVTRTTAKGAKYKYWVKINYSK